MRTYLSGIGRVLVLVLGVLIMSDDAVSQEKKPSKLESYTEKVTLKPYYGGKFLKPVENVPMYQKTDDKGTIRFWIWGPAASGTSQPTKGSEITDKDGVLWIVEKASNSASFHVVVVQKKPIEKKKP